MPNDSDPPALVNPPPNEEEVRFFAPPSSERPLHTGALETRALVDGVGVYIAPPSSPFLTAPTPSNAASLGPESTAIDAPDILADHLRDLRAPLRRQLQGFPLRLRLSEEEVSGLVKAVLHVIELYLPIAYAPARRKH